MTIAAVFMRAGNDSFMSSPMERTLPLFPSGAVDADGSSKKFGDEIDIAKRAQSKGENATGEIGGRGIMQCDRIREMAVDMSPYCDDLHSSVETTMDRRKLECRIELNETLRRDGFALVRGFGIFGIDGGLCDDALCAARSFLHEADESVRRSCLTKDRARRGYSPMSSENFASLIGEGGPNDLVRKFRIGPTASSNNANDVDDPSSHRASSLHQPNVWPTANSWDDGRASKFKSSIEEYFVRTCHAADCILRAICDGTIDDDDDDDDDRKCGSNLLESMKVLSESCRNSRRDHDKRDDKKHTSILTLLGYQPGSRHKRGSRGYMRPLISAHTDVGVITLLHFDGGKCATLERAVEASGSTDRGKIEWMDVELPPSSRDDDPVFVVNVGDCLSDLSGGSLRSTLHRVMPRPRPNNDPSSFDEEAAAPRTCLALFVGLEPTASLTLPSGEVLSYEEWRRRRIARATDVMKKSNAPNEMNHG